MVSGNFCERVPYKSPSDLPGQDEQGMGADAEDRTVLHCYGLCSNAGRMQHDAPVVSKFNRNGEGKRLGVRVEGDVKIVIG